MSPSTSARVSARVQQRVLRRYHLERAVGMPEPVAEAEEPPPILPGEDLVVLVEIGHVGKGGGEAVLVRCAQARADGVLDLSQAPGESELLLVVDALIVEDEHGIAIHAGVNGR